MVTFLSTLKMFELLCLYTLETMEAVVRSCSPKKVLLILLQNSKRNIFAGVSFFFKKKDTKIRKKKSYSTGAFSQVLQNLSEHQVLRMPADGCNDRIPLWLSHYLCVSN